jgi:UDP-N-acetylmuramyl tripeptide synthase
MDKIRYFIALWAAKLSVVALKITKHNGTNFPGTVAIKICPNFLKYVGKPNKVIGVTGTNGKTTICNLLIDMFAADNIRVQNNKLGSNINTGIATTLIRGSNFFGESKYDTGVFEIDERSALRIFPYVKPDYLIISNLFTDSVKRNAHPEFIKNILSKYMPRETKLVLNADDLISCSVAPENDRVYFGIDRMPTDIKKCINRINDFRVCPICKGELEYDYLRYHHIGKAHCKRGDFKSPEYDYTGYNVDTEKMTIEVGDTKGSGKYRLLSDSIFNIYNVVTIIAMFRELGYSHQKISNLLDSVEIIKTRFGVREAGQVRVINQMAKDRNALGSSRAFDYVSGLHGDKELILMMNNASDEKHSSENVCWLYGCDFEFLNKENIKTIIVTGPRYADYKLRLMFAGVPEDRIRCARNEIDAPDLLDLTAGESVYVFHGTDTLELCDQVIDKTCSLAEEKGGN